MSSITTHTIRYLYSPGDDTVHEYIVSNRNAKAAILEFYRKRRLLFPVKNMDKNFLNFTESLTVKETIEFYNEIMTDRTIVGLEEDTKIIYM